jgi:hypothetical protein
VRPAVANDGATSPSRFRDGVVYLNMKGSARLPVIDGNLAARHPEPLAAFRPGVVEVRPM